MGDDDVSLHARKIALKCAACGAGFRAMAWNPGMKCPDCGSEELAPAAIIEGAVDYSIANRSKGYAIEDIRFGKIAQWAGFISPYQYNQALARQKQIAEGGQHAPHIAQVFISQNVMDELQMKAVLEVYGKPRPDADDREFIKVAVQNKFITQQQGDEMTQLQRDIKKESIPPPVSVLMLEKRLMKENQIIAILRAQHKRSVGPIHEALAIIERHRPPTVVEKYIGKKGDPKRKGRATLILTAGALLVLIWAWYYGLIKFKSERIPYYCTACKEAYIAKARDAVPIRCSYCKETAALYGFYCEKCRRAYGLQSREGAKQCAHCKSMMFSQLTPEKIADYRTRIKEAREADEKGFRKSDFKVE